MAATAPSKTKDLLQLIQKSGILTPTAIGELRKLPDDAIHAATVLTRQGVLTTFQAKMLLAGKSKGFRLGQYIIQEQIGTGGMGTVYLARHAEIQRQVAIKILNATASANRLSLERFLREAQTAAALDHPNIVKLYDVVKEGDLRFLVMEYIEGETLQQMVEQGPLPASRAINYIMQAAAGLQQAYVRGIIHRDIKPSNLIVGKDGVLRILDMGLARSLDASDNVTQLLDRGAVVGTADYVSPEQAINDPKVNIRADIYSLGVTFYALVTGRPPFGGSTANKLVSHQLKDAPSVISLDKTFPPKLAGIIARMMAKRVDDRYQTPQDVIDALAPWVVAPNAPTVPTKGAKSKSSLTAARTRPDNPVSQSSKRIPKWVVFAVGGAVILLMAFVIVSVLMLNAPK